jgi:hypothetical protein
VDTNSLLTLLCLRNESPSSFTSTSKTNVIILPFDYSQLQVSDKNKQEYLTLLVDYLLKDSISPQINEFKKGFREIIPEDFLCVFDWNELELLICGIPDISIGSFPSLFPLCPALTLYLISPSSLNR